MENRLIDQLPAVGLKRTSQRRLVCRVLDDTAEHPDAPEIHRLVNEMSDTSISLSTVYRILAELEKQGLVQRREFGDLRGRYEKTTMARHDHLIDKKSGNVLGFEDPSIEAKLRKIADEAGYELLDYALNLFVVPHSRASRRGKGGQSSRA